MIGAESVPGPCWGPWGPRSVPARPEGVDRVVPGIAGLRVPINHPSSSGRMLVLAQGSAESISSVDLQVSDLPWFGDPFG